MTTERSGMSFTRDELLSMAERLRSGDVDGDSDNTAALMIEAYAGHLSRDAVVSDEDVHRFQKVYDDEWDKAVEADPGSLKGTADHKATMAALSSFAARHAAVPDGYVLVPVEPTTDMQIAGAKHLINGPSGQSYADEASRVYKAMLAQRDGGTDG